MWAKTGRVTRGASRRVIKAEANDHNRQGKRVALNRVPESLVRRTAPVPEVTIADYCHGNLVQVQSLVNRIVDLLAINVGRHVNSQVAPPVIPQGVSTVVPANRALTVGQLQRQVAGATSPRNDSKAAVAHAVASHVPTARCEPIRHTKSDSA